MGTAVYIGRFQPFHNGHLKLIEKGVSLFDRVLVIIGSNGGDRTLKDPFNAAERISVIQKATNGLPVFTDVVNDHQSDYAWFRRVRETVKSRVCNDAISIIGHKKDGSSYYLSGFPDWPLIETGRLVEVDATLIRESMFKHGSQYLDNRLVPPASLELIRAFCETEAYRKLKEMYHGEHGS